MNPDYVKAYIRRAQIYEETDKFHEALEDYKKILTFDSGHAEANAAVRVNEVALINRLFIYCYVFNIKELEFFS